MPCKCEETEEAKILKERGLPTAKLRFVGGARVSPSGPYSQYDYGKVYEVSARYANREAYPYWAPVEEHEELDTASTDSSEDDFTASAEIEDEPSEGLTTLAFTISKEGNATDVGGFTEKEMFAGMDVPTLRIYVSQNGGKVDKRWGKKRLIQEALKL